MSEVICPSCGHRNLPGSNFCSSCGTALARVPDAEPATVTFKLDSITVPVEPEIEVPATEIGPGGALVVTRGPNVGARFALEHVITTAGRHPDSDIFLDDVTVSRRHVELERGTSGSVVRDVGSLNGTYLNGQRIEGDAAIRNGDELQVGKFKLTFIDGEAG